MNVYFIKMNQLKKKQYKKEIKEKRANVKQLLLSDDYENNIIGLMLAVTQLKWSSERICRTIMKPCYLANRRYVKFNDCKIYDHHRNIQEAFKAIKETLTMYINGLIEHIINKQI